MTLRGRGLETEKSFNVPGPVKLLGALVGAFLVVVLAWNLILDNFFGYLWFGVSGNEVGVKFQGNRPYDVSGPGVWSNFGFFETMRTVKVEGLPFKMKDDEVLTKDKQRIGVEVTGTVHRPGQDKADILLANWSNYSNFYLNDNLLVGYRDRDKDVPGLMQSLGQQAAKVCVGELNFDDAVIGAARDVLRECVDEKLDGLAKGYGLEVRNVVVPNVVLSPEVQKKLDEITAARFSTELATQRKLQVDAEARQQQAVEEGRIRVEQGRIQEKAKQDKLTADLERQAQDAQYALIEAQKKNQLLQANEDYKIAQVNRQVAEERAKAELAPKIAEAQMFQTNAGYLDLKKTEAVAGAWKNTDKVIVPQGTTPTMVIGNSGTTVLVPSQSSGSR